MNIYIDDKKKRIAIELRNEVERLNELINEAHKLKLTVDFEFESILKLNMNKPRLIDKIYVTEKIEY